MVEFYSHGIMDIHYPCNLIEYNHTNSAYYRANSVHYQQEKTHRYSLWLLQKVIQFRQIIDLYLSSPLLYILLCKIPIIYIFFQVCFLCRYVWDLLFIYYVYFLSVTYCFCKLFFYGYWYIKVYYLFIICIKYNSLFFLSLSYVNYFF